MSNSGELFVKVLQNWRHNGLALTGPGMHFGQAITSLAHLEAGDTLELIVTIVVSPSCS